MTIPDRPKRVLQLSTMVPPARFGGAESVVGAFGERLAAVGFDVHNVGLKARHGDGPGVPIPNLYWPFDGRRHGVAGRLVWHAIDALTLNAHGAVRRVVDEIRPDVIVTHNLRGWGLAPWVLADRCGIPLVQVIHDYGLLCNSSTLFHAGEACHSAPCRLRQRASQRRWSGGALIGVSQAVLDEHRRRGFATDAPSFVVHPVRAGSDVVHSTRPRSAGAPHTLGYLGRLSEEKGIGLLLDSVAGTGRRLVIAGDGEAGEVETLRRHASAIGADVQWRGWTAPQELFDDIDVLVVPSLWREPFGLVVTEAARAGVPVLLAGQPGLIEAAQASAARHHIFAADDVAALRRSLDVPIEEYRVDQAATPSADIADIVNVVLAQRDSERIG